MRILGIDLGSREVKIALTEEGKLVKKMKVSTMSFYRDYCSFNGKVVVDLEKLGIDHIDKAVSTGYGRNNINLEEFEPINEIKAHVYGALYQSKLKDFILLDVGGQDIKIVKVEKGIATDLDLNDKCAASCGRYLENMANVLEISVDELFKHHKDPIPLNSTCAVFSESELIGKIAEGVPLNQLCASVNYSLYKRLHSLLNQFKGKKLIISGGVASNTAFRHYLAKDYDEIIAIEEPQLNGAIGCCYYGEKKVKKEEE
ncbi:MAG: 2-hydroxyglutaryl-CoA dehydratase [Clostridiaceae bacterium]|nr:2-hydroxyglutaryl-CoA dehydratase [Clostridiaceae bacterium]